MSGAGASAHVLEAARFEAPCEHKFVYAGVRFKIGPQIRGSSARDVYYAHVYFCDKCLTTKGQQIGCEGNDYAPIRYVATPAVGDEVEVPKANYRF